VSASRHIDRLQGAGILFAGLAIVALAAVSAIGPVLETQRSIADSKERIRRFEIAARAALRIQDVDTSMVVSTGSTPEERSLAVQRALVDHTRLAGLQMRQLSVAKPRQLDRGLARLTYNIDAAGDIEHLITFLKQVGEMRPAVFVDKVSLKTGPAPRADLNLSIQMEVSVYTLNKVAAP
jgi:hypothetical protein